MYKEVLVYSEPEHIFYTAHLHGHPIKGHGLLHPAFLNQQIVREAYEAYHGCTMFTADVVMLSVFLASKIDRVGWISIPTTYFGSFMSFLDLNSRELSLSCQKLRTIILESFARNPVIDIRRCAKLIDVKTSYT